MHFSHSAGRELSGCADMHFGARREPRDQCRHFVRRHGLAEQEALRLVAAFGGYPIELFLGFDALRRDPIEFGALVPWIAYWPPDNVIAAAPIGLAGDPLAITSGTLGRSRLSGHRTPAIPSRGQPLAFKWGLAGLATGHLQVTHKIVRRQRPAEEEALAFLAPQFAQDAELGLGLNALGDDGLAKGPGQANDRRDQGPIPDFGG
jgi:hypothetical protein